MVLAEKLSRREWLFRARTMGAYTVAATLVPGAFQGSDASTGEDIRIACVGDSMIDGIWGGLLRLVSKEACLKPRLKLGRYGENGTGLTRADKYDWAGEVSTIIAEFAPQLVLVSFGLNDRQSVVGPGGKPRCEYGSAEWNHAYMEAVMRFLRHANATAAGVLWIGIPAMRDKVTRADAQEKNLLYAEAIATLADPKVGFVEPWRQNGSDDDSFKAYGLDGNGARVQTRSPDGIHFTAVGYDMVASYLLPKIVAHLRASNIEIAYPCGK